jgi:L-threonylcarbamoyladenylate synthase
VCCATAGSWCFRRKPCTGLGRMRWMPRAVARIFRAKERPPTDPLIVHVASLAEAARVAREVPAVARALAERFWPGALTLILPKRAGRALRGDRGARLGRRPCAGAPGRARAARGHGVPVAAPSANRFSRPSPTRASHVLQDLDGRVDLILDAGPTDIGVESTVLDLTVESAARPPPGRRHDRIPAGDCCRTGGEPSIDSATARRGSGAGPAPAALRAARGCTPGTTSTSTTI